MRTQRGHKRLSFGVVLLEPAYLLAAPQGFEPRYADPESAVLPLNEGAAARQRSTRADARTLIGLYWLREWSVNLAAHARPMRASRELPASRTRRQATR